MHSLTQSSMPAHSIATATALLTAVALGCIFALSVLSDGYHDQRLRPISLPRTFRGTKTIDQVRQRRPVAFMRNIAHGRRLSNDQDSDIPDNYGNKQGHQKPALSFALVRPISVRDADALVNSFIYWDEFAPGTNKGCHSSNHRASIDIIISFSREFDEQKYPDIAEAMGAVRSLFEKTNGWGGCIQSVKMFEARIHPEEDLYDPLLAEQGNRMWANGPNRQFERTFRYVQSLDKYDAMFLMESDTYPAADGWLDLLIEEVKSSAPFALLGSKYNGHAWDDFAGQMPLALLHHINGNAIYNITHPLLEHIVSELEDEADTWYNAITYDYRISQILLEGSTGAPPDFPYANVGVDGNRIKLEPKTEKFSRWWKKYPDAYELVQESNVMTNLGSTAFLPGDVEDGIALVHGKNMYLPWDSSIHGNVSLVISDWGEMDEPYKEFLSKLNAIDHPYSEIILMASLESEDFVYNVSKWCNSTINLPLVIQNRTHDEATDLCNAEPTTDYFMLTDVGHAPREEKIELMVASDGSNRPVIPFVSSESVHCSTYQSCNTVIQEARQHYDGMNRFIFSDEMLFQRDLLQNYCRELRDHADPTIISKGNIDNGLMKLTATGYIAFLHGIEVVDSHYAFSNIVVEGSRRNFVPADPRIPLGLKYHVASVTDRSTAKSEVPVLWHIPKSGGTTMLTLLSWCLRQTVASSSGVVLERQQGKLGTDDFPRHLYTIKDGVATFVSVDVSSSKGIIRARDLDLIGSGIADAVVTPLLSKAVLDLFSPDAGRRARIFSVFRHPVERAVSLFYYLQNATWERTYDPTLQNMTLEEYATSEKAESNWMVRMLNNEPAAVDDRHLEIAKRILREKVLIGLTSQMEESVRRFYAYFGWGESGGEWNQCERRLLFGGANTNDHHGLEEGTMAWNLLSSRNALDVALYDYAIELFHRQGANLFESNSFSPGDSLAPGMTRVSDIVDDEIHQLLDLNASRQLESNVADGDIVSFRSPLSCSEIKDGTACAGRHNCVWKESSKICESNVFGHSAKVEYKSHSRKECMLLQPKRNVLRCLKRKKRLCRAIENRHRKLRCRNKQTKKIQKIRKALDSRVLSQSTSFQSRPLHILSLGGSVTWGSQLDDRSLAYPALLSKVLPGTSFATNIAMRASGSDYASMCLQSMIIDGQSEQDFYFDLQENEVNYDVVTIEYSLNGVEALPRLLQRLRARYPDATIIYVNLYSWAQGVIESTSQQRIYEIKARIMKEDGPEKTAEWIAGLKQNYHRQLTFRGHLSAAKYSLIEGSIQKYGGTMYNWPVPTNPIDDLIWFASDLYHLNAVGHRRVAEDLSKIIRSNLHIVTSNQVANGWDTNNEDQCTSWYHSGISDSVEMSKAIHLFSPGKYAIETTKSDPVTIGVTNPYNRTMPVGLGVMSHKEIYPKALVAIQAGTMSVTNHSLDLGGMDTTILDPSNRIMEERAFHVVQTHFIGLAEEGQNTITIEPMEDAHQPLRITGIVMCNGCGLTKLSLPGHEGYLTDVKDPSEISKFTTEVPCPWPPRPTLHDTRASYKNAYGRSFGGYIQTMKERYESSDSVAISSKSHDLRSIEQVKPTTEYDVVVFPKGGKIIFPYSRDSNDIVPQGAAWNDTFVVPNRGKGSTTPDVWIEPKDTDRFRPVDRILQGNYITFVSWFSGNYGHFLHDHLPVIAWLREILHPTVKLLLLHHPRHEEILKTLDPLFVADRIEWIKRRELVQIRGGKFAVLRFEQTPHRTIQTVESLGRWLNEAQPSKMPLDSSRKIVYYSRGGSADTHHGRVVEESHEADIIALIRAKMEENKRPEELVLFNGQKDRKTMAIRDQFELFRNASTVIGPHGSGLANVLWMDPNTISTSNITSTNCREGPKILEFLLGPDSAQVHPPCRECKGIPFTRTYYHLFSTIPWVNYNHLLFASNSTAATTYIHLRALAIALDDMWGQK